MERSDVRKRRAERDRTNILVSRAGLLQVAESHRNLASECRALATKFDEEAAYLEGLVAGSIPSDD